MSLNFFLVYGLHSNDWLFCFWYGQISFYWTNFPTDKNYKFQIKYKTAIWRYRRKTKNRDSGGSQDLEQRTTTIEFPTFKVYCLRGRCSLYHMRWLKLCSLKKPCNFVAQVKTQYEEIPNPEGEWTSRKGRNK